MTNVIRVADSQAVAQAAAERWVSIAAEAVEARGAFRVALSGGSTPQPLYRLLAEQEWQAKCPWQQTFVFWGDERRVPPDNPRSDYGMVNELLLKHVPVPRDQVFRMDGESLSRSAEYDYTLLLERQFNLGPRDWPRFDLVLLGMGPDGHTASIFPGTRAVSDLSNRVLAYSVPQLHEERITLTLPVLNHAAHIIFLVAGSEKADTLAAVLYGDYRPSTFPAQAIKPVDGDLTWIVDQAAAAKLPE